MFNFKFKRTNEGNYEALLLRRFSNLEWRDEDLERMGGERIEGTTLKIVIKPSLVYGEKYYTADLLVNDYHVIDEVGYGHSLKWCKEEIKEWLENHFWALIISESKDTYWSKILKEEEEYFHLWRQGKTPSQIRKKETQKKAEA
jgi:hypothetical protein